MVGGNGEDSEFAEAPSEDDIIEEKKQCIERARSKQFLIMFHSLCYVLFKFIFVILTSLTHVFFIFVHQGFSRKLLTILELQHPN